MSKFKQVVDLEVMEVLVEEAAEAAIELEL
jgi:hypothetical protein